MAVVLTYNAPDSLARCLGAVAAQTSPPEAVLVVDNAGEEKVVPEALPARLQQARVVRSDRNLGPAGGYALALTEFLASGYGHAWVLDDDMVPESNCLERLWADASKDPDSAFVFPVTQQADGSLGDWPSWCGFVIARPIVEKVGVPREELIWWAEDTEYLQWRIPEAGYVRRIVGDAIVHHDSIRRRDSVPTWKYYYEARNMLYVHKHVKRRLGRYPRSLSLLVARALLREKHGRIPRLAAIGRGLLDGWSGRLGMRYPVQPMRERKLAPGGPCR
jgi:GT2 family glycosyltransferase